MRNFIVIFIAVTVTLLNINSIGVLDQTKLEYAKVIAYTNEEIKLKNTFDWTIGFGLFKFFHFAELMFLSEVSRKKFLNSF